MTAPPEPTTLTIDGLLDLRQVHDANLRRQGDLVAYVVADNVSAARERKPASRIWAVGASGDRPRPLTAEGTRAHAPRWSPDGRCLAFLGNRDAQEQDQLFVLDEPFGEPDSSRPTPLASPTSPGCPPAARCSSRAPTRRLRTRRPSARPAATG